MGENDERALQELRRRMGLAESPTHVKDMEPAPVAANVANALVSADFERANLPTMFIGAPPLLKNMPPQFAVDDDSTLCRFLRARQFDVDKAEKMLREYIEHRERWHLDTILDEEDPLEMLWQHSAPVVHTGYDKIGRPVIIKR
jgi:hypothetical protein